VIAEGIETQAQFNGLAALGCQSAQGFLFGKPQAIEAFAGARNLAVVERAAAVAKLRPGAAQKCEQPAHRVLRAS
jgi:sensor c-di-GMP phosphodiesterase-like protein